MSSENNQFLSRTNKWLSLKKAANCRGVLRAAMIAVSYTRLSATNKRSPQDPSPRSTPHIRPIRPISGSNRGRRSSESGTDLFQLLVIPFRTDSATPRRVRRSISTATTRAPVPGKYAPHTGSRAYRTNNEDARFTSGRGLVGHLSRHPLTGRITWRPFTCDVIGRSRPKREPSIGVERNLVFVRANEAARAHSFLFRAATVLLNRFKEHSAPFFCPPATPRNSPKLR
jgi:hypothetical protein